MEISKLRKSKRAHLPGVCGAAALAVVLGGVSLFSQSQPAQPEPANQATTAATGGKRPIQTKTKEEYDAYQVAVSNSLQPEAMEKAADDFARQFPASEVRVLLYRAAMSSYQSIGNLPKMTEMAMKVLALDGDDPEALIALAEDLQEHTAPTDLDRQQRGEQAIANANHALKSIDTDLSVPAGTAPEKVEAYKRSLRATALGIIGSIYYKQEKYPEAEAQLRQSIDADSANPDPVTILRLALALDQQKKYDQALEQANRAVQLTKAETNIGKMARDEHDRLMSQATVHQTPPGTTSQVPENSPSSSGAPSNNGSGQGSGPN